MGDTKKVQERPYLSELGVFSREVARMRDEALHVRRVLLDEISLLESEIAGRRGRVAEQEEVVARCEAALQLPQGPGVAAAQQRAIAENEAADLGAPDYEEAAANHHESKEN